MSSGVDHLRFGDHPIRHGIPKSINATRDHPPVARRRRNAGTIDLRSFLDDSGSQSSRSGPSQLERKLAAILAADVAGYTRLMGVDEEGTLNALRSHREVVDGLVTTHRGRVFNTAGDSVMAEFQSAVDATLCAIAIQQATATRNEAVPRNKRVEFRIGLNIGDVMVDGGNLFGDGVNVADRVQKLAQPGGICVSRNVYDQIRAKIDLPIDSMGEHRVKNISAPLTVYRVVLDSASRKPWPIRRLATMWRQHRAAAVLTMGAVAILAAVAGWYWHGREEAPTDFPSLAILPFENVGGDPGLDHLSDGVTQDLVTVLSRFPDITLVSQATLSDGNDAGTDAARLRQQLKVDYILEGSVQRKGSGARITARLLDAHATVNVWGDEYEGADLGALQDDAVRRIVGSLTSQKGQIRKYEYRRIAGKPRTGLNEYEYFLAGDEIYSRFESAEENERGGAIWREGLAKFPDSALLRIAVAYYHLERVNFGSDTGEADAQQAAKLAREALGSDSPSPMVQCLSHRLLVDADWSKGNFEGAIGHAEAAVALAPYNARQLSLLAPVQMAAGNTSRAIEWLLQSERLDPAIPENTSRLAWAYYLRGEYEKSIEAARRHLDLSRENAGEAYWYLATGLVRLGRVEEAKAAVKKYLEVVPNETVASARDFYRTHPYKDPGVAERELADIATAGLPEK
jgi:class 3 adenylate cyclase/TolB-like protein/tetratricopeptide (TPR) repeat protein